jgi:hypothetical protein
LFRFGAKGWRHWLLDGEALSCRVKCVSLTDDARGPSRPGGEKSLLKFLATTIETRPFGQMRAVRGGIVAECLAGLEPAAATGGGQPKNISRKSKVLDHFSKMDQLKPAGSCPVYGSLKS